MSSRLFEEFACTAGRRCLEDAPSARAATCIGGGVVSGGGGAACSDGCNAASCETNSAA